MFCDLHLYLLIRDLQIKMYDMKNKLIKNGLGCFLLMMLLSHISCTNKDNRSANEKIVRTVYAAYEKKDWNMLTSVFADGFNFTSPVDDHIGIKEYKVR